MSLSKHVSNVLEFLRWCCPRYGESRKLFDLAIRELKDDEEDQRSRGHGELRIAVSVLSNAGWVVLDAFRRLTRRAVGAPSPADVVSQSERVAHEWRAGRVPKERHLRFMERHLTVLSPDEDARVRAILANIKYLRGQFTGARKLIEPVMTGAFLRAESDPTNLMLLGYPHWNTDLFIGRHEEAARGLVALWHRFKKLTSDDRERLLFKIQGASTVHAVGSIPRHVVLAWALGDWPLVSPDSDARLDSDALDLVDRWLREGLRLCDGDRISTDFSNAYAAFAYTLEVAGGDSRAEAKVRRLLGAIPQDAPAPSRYAASGFEGIFYLACGDDEGAYQRLACAAQLGTRTSNEFLGPLFTAAEAVALAHLERWYEAECCLDRFDDWAPVSFHVALRRQATGTVRALRSGTSRPDEPSLSPRIARLLRARVK